MNPDTKTQITAAIGIAAIVIKMLFKIELPPEIKENIAALIGGVILLVMYFQRGATKKLEAKIDAK